MSTEILHKLLQASILAPTFFKEIRENELLALEKFSQAIGIAFQIQDDLIEAEGDLETIGKSIESDKTKNKAAYPILFGLDQSKERVDILYKDACESLSIFEENATPLIEMAEIVIKRKL